MHKKLVEIREMISPGYQPVFDFDTWFVLIKGKSVLSLGEGDMNIEKIRPQVMEPGKIYNLKQSVWHTTILSQEGSVVIVENRNTGNNNSNYSTIDPDQRHVIIDTFRQEQADR
jgi:hypothetical protein